MLFLRLRAKYTTIAVNNLSLNRCSAFMNGTGVRHHQIHTLNHALLESLENLMTGRLISLCYSLALGCLVLAASPASAITQMLDLQMEPYSSDSSVNRLNVEISASLAGVSVDDSELTRITGNSLATINYELVNDVPVIDQLTFTGGEVKILGATTANPSFTLEKTVFLLGTLVDVDINSDDLRVTVLTTNPPGTVSNGIFSLEQHEIVPTHGILTATGSALGSSINETINFAEEDLSFTQAGTGNIALTQIGASGLDRTYKVTVTIPVDTQETFPVSDSLDATITLAGTLISSDTFTITLGLEGDYNDDGKVDLADYTVWRNNLGAAAGTLDNDPNTTAIGIAQYQTWKANFGAQAAGALSTATVPEPATLTLVGVGFVAALLSYRRRK